MNVFPNNKTINQLSNAEKVKLVNDMITNGIKICKGQHWRSRKQGIFKRIGPDINIITNNYKDMFYYGRCFQFLLDLDIKNNTIESLLSLSWNLIRNGTGSCISIENLRLIVGDCTWKDEVDNPSRVRCYCGNAKFMYYEDLETLENPESYFLDNWQCFGYLV